MPESNATFAHRWFDEVWNKGREAAIDEMRHPGGRVYGFPSPDSVTDDEGFKQTYRLFQQAFSNIHVTVDDQVVEDNKIAARWTATGTHAGDAFGFPATNKPVKFSGVTFLYLRDGKLTDGWNFFDFTRVLQDLRGA